MGHIVVVVCVVVNAVIGIIVNLIVDLIVDVIVGVIVDALSRHFTGLPRLCICESRLNCGRTRLCNNTSANPRPATHRHHAMHPRVVPRY
jgi:hypothetical protein